MISGVEIDGKHCYLDFNALLAHAEYDDPEELNVEDDVPYHAEPYDFTDLYGARILQRRNVTYRFKFVHPDRIVNEDNLARFKAFLYSLTEDAEIREDDMPSYHWVGKRKKITNVKDTVGYAMGARMVEVTFSCKPYRASNTGETFTPDETRWPDVDLDDEVSAADAAEISIAAANIGAGEPSGLTEEQELRADCDRNGIIDASDAQLALQFVSEIGAGNYENSPAGWAAFLNDAFGRNPEVI